jgi:hypothetical protein
MAKAIKRDTQVKDESLSIPEFDDAGIDSNDAALQRNFEKIANSSVAIDALDFLANAKDEELKEAPQNFVKLDNIGDSFVGIYMGKREQPRFNQKPLIQLTFTAYDSETGEIFPAVMNETAQMRSLFSLIKIGTPIKLTLKAVQKAANGGKLKIFDLRLKK